jgi:hypothetical protein
VRNLLYFVTGVTLLILATTALGATQNAGVQQPTAVRQLSRIHTAHSIDDELDRLTKDLELTPEQQPRVRALLGQHQAHEQALFDKHPSASRQALAPQIHAISDATHAAIHAMLTAHQRDLEAALRRQH